MRKTATALAPYHKKRNFSVTPEPRGGQRARSSRDRPLQFVVQKHAARQLHYDFRLELAGTLKSWAVPKGPSLDPASKRMAVKVEDHPLDYAGFEGVIPAGYGAGTVIVWDRGEWIPLGDPVAGYREGKLHFELRGKKLRGGWALVRTTMGADKGRENWLLIKERDDAAMASADFDVLEAQPDSVLTDTAAPPRSAAARKKTAPARTDSAAMPAAARPARLPPALAPQLATLATAAPPQGEWSYEIKFDGYRVLARIDAGAVTLFTRNGHDWTAKLPGLQRAVARLGLDSGWLDGEIVVMDASGAPDFQALQNAMDGRRLRDIQYFVFDLPYCNGHDLRPSPLRERRALLRSLLAAAPVPLITFSENFEVAPDKLLAKACAMHWEGLIAKRLDAPYVSKRSLDWLKLKCLQRQEFVIAGYTDPKGELRSGGFGALLLGTYRNDTLHYAGRVGTGFSAESMAALLKKFQRLHTATTPFATYRDSRGVRDVHWLKPTLIAEVAFSQWTGTGLIRHGVFRGLRTDKPPRAVTREHAVDTATATKPTRKKAPVKKPEKAATASGAVKIGTVTISHADRVIDRSTGITKGQLAEFYRDMAPLLLPHLRGRPTAVVRAPAGVEGEQFFQKHAGALQIPGLRLLDTRLDPGHPPLLEIPSLKALSGCAQMNVVEFHTWNARTRRIDAPDRIVFDLDPGAGISWAQIIHAADILRGLLDLLGLTGFLKTSGGKGLHVVVPIGPGHSWEAAFEFSAAVTRHLARTLPRLFVAKSGPDNRVRRIFVDYLRNRRGATTVAALSARARPGLGVSVPVSWKQLDALTGSAQWTVADGAAIVAQMKKQPWAGYANTRQSLHAAHKVLLAAP